MVLFNLLINKKFIFERKKLARRMHSLLKARESKNEYAAVP